MFAPTSADPLVAARRGAYVNHSQIAALVGARVYDTQAPDDAAYPRITLGAMSERDELAFGSGGNEVTFTDHLWAKPAAGAVQRAHSGLVLPLWGWVHEALMALEGVEIVPGVRIVEMTASLASIAADPVDRTIMHGVVLGRVLTEVA